MSHFFKKYISLIRIFLKLVFCFRVLTLRFYIAFNSITKLNVRDTFALGFMTFHFIGAGNIIFPPIIAYQAGDHIWLTALGFLVTTVGTCP